MPAPPTLTPQWRGHSWPRSEWHGHSWPCLTEAQAGMPAPPTLTPQWHSHSWLCLSLRGQEWPRHFTPVVTATAHPSPPIRPVFGRATKARLHWVFVNVPSRRFDLLGTSAPVIKHLALPEGTVSPQQSVRFPRRVPLKDTHIPAQEMRAPGAMPQQGVDMVGMTTAALTCQPRLDTSQSNASSTRCAMPGS